MADHSDERMEAVIWVLTTIFNLYGANPAYHSILSDHLNAKAEQFDEENKEHAAALLRELKQALGEPPLPQF